MLIKFLIKEDNDLLTDCGFLKGDYNRLCLEFDNTLLEQNEVYLSYFRNEEESIDERTLNR